MTKPLARLVIKDLVKGDAASKELQAMQNILNITNSKLLIQSDLVINLRSQITNYKSILTQKDTQIKTQEEISNELKKALKRERRTKKLYQIGSAVGVAAIILNVLSAK